MSDFLYRLGETGLDISNISDKIEDETLRDETGFIYYNNKEDKIVSVDRDARRNLIIHHILEDNYLDYLPININIFSYYEKSIKLKAGSNLINEIGTIRINKSLFEGYTAIIYADIIALDESGYSISDISYNIEREMNVTFSFDSADITVPITSQRFFQIPEMESDYADITILEIPTEVSEKDEYLIGFYIAFLKEV